MKINNSESVRRLAAAIILRAVKDLNAIYKKVQIPQNDISPDEINDIVLFFSINNAWACILSEFYAIDIILNKVEHKLKIIKRHLESKNINKKNIIIQL